MEDKDRQTAAKGANAEKVEKFKGYTLDELRYQRALIALRKEFSKENTLHNARRISKFNPLKGGSGMGRAGQIATKLLSGMNYIDYALLGFSAFSTIRKFTSFFRRKKK